MLIGIDASRALRAQRTGSENYSLQVIRHLLALGGHRYRLYTEQRPRPGLFAAPAGLPTGAATPIVPELRVMPFPRLWTHLRLSGEMVAHAPDVLFVPAHVLPLWHPRRSVVTLHDLGYRHFPGAHPPRARAYLDWSTRFSARSAAHVLADSQATKDDLVRFTGVAADKVTVVYLGRDPHLTRVEEPQRLAEVQRRLRIWRAGEPAPRVVLYVGTLQPRKNLVRLIDAFARVAAGHPERRLVLAGPRGWLADPILQRIDALGLGDSVICPGFVDEADLPALFSAAACFAFPSLYEGFGMPVLEAQACGAPVLAANTSSLPEVAGDAALLVDPLDVDAMAAGLRRLLDDDALCSHLRQAGYRNIERFSWSRCARDTLRVLEAVSQT